MTEQTTKYRRSRRWLRRLVWGIAILVVVGVLLRLSLKTNVVQNWVKNYIVSTANQQLNATLSIDRLSGDLWDDITLSGIYLTQDDTVAQVDSVHATYNIWAIIDGSIEMSQLGIFRPQIMLRQEGDEWNVQKILPFSADTTEDGQAMDFSVNSLSLNDGYISVQSDSIPLESNFRVNNLMLSSSLAFAGDSYSIDLRDLSFQVDNTQLEQSVRVRSAGSAKQNQITLEKLILATGGSLLEASAYANSADSLAKLDFSASPVDWQDMASYARDYPLRQDLQIDLGLEGTPEQFGVTLAMQAEGLDSFEATSRFRWQSGLILQQLNAKADYFDPQLLLADTTLPSLQNFDAAFSGHIDMTNYQEGEGELEFSAEDISRAPYHLDLFSGKASLSSQSATLEVEAMQMDQTIKSNLQVDKVWADMPSVKATIRGTNVDPAYWMQDTTLAGNLSFQTEISGRGWYPQENLWKYSLTMDDSQMMGQSINDFLAKGEFNNTDIGVEARMPIDEGLVTIRSNLRDMMNDPSYDYDIVTRNLDLGFVTDRKNFTTALNGKISGNGQGFDPSSMRLNTSIAVDSSLVNGEFIRNLTLDLAVSDSVAVVDSAQLQSSIADGSFNLRFNILRHYDADNELALDLTLKNPDALAPLAGVEDLRGEGAITGKLMPHQNENLRFLGTTDLSDVKYNELFAAERARGSMDIRTEQNLTYIADLDLSKPSFSGVQLQNLTLMTQGNYADSRAQGKYRFRFSSPNEGRIEQDANYSITADTVQIRTTSFNFISDYRTLTLEEPFELLIQNDTLRMDTMRVSSGDGAFFETGIPILSSTEQRGFIRGQSLNTEVIQSSLLGETYFDGILSGEFNITRQGTNLNAQGQMLLSEIMYEETNIDSLLISGKVADERLDGMFSLRHEGKELASGKADLPFKLGDPENFENSFFEESVNGTIRVRDITIERFQTLFAEAGITESSGILSFQGNLDGTAGKPEFTGDASLRKAQLSGVAIDSITAGMDYRHEDADLQLNAVVMSLQQKAAEVNARFPLFIDMQTFRVDLPEPEDSITVDVETNNFNLKALNDFLDRVTVREVAGRLDGKVHIMGAMKDLKTDGHLELKNGAFRFVPAGIRVDNIHSTIAFDPNQIRLTDFSARSGKGNLKASGIVELEKLVPGDLDMKIRAQNFRAANTTQYNAIIDLNARAQGEVTKPKITGSLSFISGFLQLDNFGEKSVENIELDQEENNGPSVSIYDSLALDMDINFDRRFFIRNQRYLEMELELAGQVDLLKEAGDDLELFGSMRAPNGYARPFGKEFDLEDGAVTFNGPPGNPELAIRTRYEPPQTQEDIIIWYVIEGTVEKPKFRYESQPEMELENIISYTIFGRPFYALDSWQQVVASSGNNTSAADVALDVLLDRVETLATQKLGIDVVKIDNTHVGGETGTSITTGWYINPKVFFAIQNVITGSTPDTGFLLEYMLRKDLKLIIQQGNDIRQGVDLQWNYEY